MSSRETMILRRKSSKGLYTSRGYKKHGASYVKRSVEFDHRVINPDPLTRKKTITPKPKSTKARKRHAKKKLALLLPGHNEELIIQTTIQTALAAGQNKADIYMVDDDSSDLTRKKAIEMLGKKQVLTVPRSGKAGAVYAAINHFKLVERYRWVHIADADSVFGKDYFRIFRRAITGTDCVVALGFVQSLRGNWICHYRAFTYTFSQHIIRRFQSWFGLIAVFPGPITAFRTDIIPKLDFLSGTIAEDFDITLQVHRNNLGKIKFIPEAVNFTQDPETIKNFIKQNLRWQRGFFQGVRKYRVGTKLQRIDVSVGYQMIETVVFVVQSFILIPYVAIATHNLELIPVVIVADFFVVSLVAIFCAVSIKRISTIACLPYFYFLRWIEVFVLVYAAIEIFVLGKFKTRSVGWSTEGRRYALDAAAMKDGAK